jgi:ketosteroid isomerase-like protein
VDERDTIAATHGAFAEAVRKGDAEAAAAVFAAGARLLPPTAGEVEGREAIAAYWRTGVETGLVDAALEARDLRRFDGVAYEVGRYTLRLEPADGPAVVDRGDYVLVHERQDDGNWQWAVEMFNPDVPPTQGGPCQGREKE